MHSLAMIMALLLLCGHARAADAKPGASDCAIDWARYMAQDLNTFDQGADGFRGVISAGDLCVADLIASYRKANPAVLDNPDAYLLYWHEGQYRAFAGQSERAQELFGQSRMRDGPAADMWNLYVDGSVAFLRQDRPALLEARAALAALPPETYRPIPRPMNLDVLDGLIGCFGKPYAEAYGAACRQ
ncbi:hypothetical protein OU994_26705 [Pseudoduganella sp. SL102]|uniref:hypothetical protein n=1 Tax=Pseudoduganella sp. SL102 TaxID=2995154 RepID=UPI00248CEB8E|nr:hypothetical protein [Pseudoduganella sp. SL102]WBS01814.1 hypothetical protein OU994_26705 [Pseudoduganella sp. SL102]